MQIVISEAIPNNVIIALEGGRGKSLNDKGGVLRSKKQGENEEGKRRKRNSRILS